MKHPSEATLALHAGDDLGIVARWRVERHLSGCERCRGELAAFRAVTEIAPDLAETPEISWNRLAAEMKANIRLGLAAGECVRNDAAPARAAAFSTPRTIVALASVVALMVTGLMLERPAPHPKVARQEGVVVQTMTGGIQVRDGGEALRLRHYVQDARDVTFTAGAQGSMRIRYVDSETGNVTINSVYAE